MPSLHTGSVPLAASFLGRNNTLTKHCLRANFAQSALRSAQNNRGNHQSRPYQKGRLAYFLGHLKIVRSQDYMFLCLSKSRQKVRLPASLRRRGAIVNDAFRGEKALYALRQLSSVSGATRIDDCIIHKVTPFRESGIILLSKTKTSFNVWIFFVNRIKRQNKDTSSLPPRKKRVPTQQTFGLSSVAIQTQRIFCGRLFIRNRRNRHFRQYAKQSLFFFRLLENNKGHESFFMEITLKLRVNVYCSRVHL